MPYATGSTGLVLTVRGSSRRIMIMRFRPADIRLINVAYHCPDCCSLCPCGKTRTTTKHPTIRGVDTVTPYQGLVLALTSRSARCWRGRRAGLAPRIVVEGWFIYGLLWLWCGVLAGGAEDLMF